MRKLWFGMIIAVFNLSAAEIYSTFDVVSGRESELSLSYSGIVKKRYVDVGDSIKKETLLLELENSQESIEVELAKNKVESAKALFEHAKNTYGRYDAIKDVIDKERLENLKVDMDVKKIELQKAENELRLKEVLLKKTKLYAPYDGVVLRKYVESGDGVLGASTKLFGVSDFPDVKLIISFDEKYWKEVKVGQKFVYKIDGLDTKLEGSISKIYPSAEVSSRKVKAEVSAKNIMPGLFGDGVIVTE